MRIVSDVELEAPEAGKLAAGARAVPALIRALPRALLPSSSDYGLIVGDQELAELVQAHDLSKGRGSGTSTWEGPDLRSSARIAV